jgi:hypothetical protein
VQPAKQHGQADLPAALDGLIGAVNSEEGSGGRKSHLSEGEDAFGEILVEKYRKQGFNI